MHRRHFVKSLAGFCGLALLQPTRAGAQTTLRIASVTAPQHHHNVALRWFAERVKNDDQNLDVKVLDGSQLGGERDYIEGMILGSIEMAQVSTGPIAAFIPEFDIFSLPYLFRNTDHFVKVLDGPVGAECFKLLEGRGIKGLCWFDNGYRDIFNSKRAIKEPADLKGLKIRSMESPVMIDTLNSMGASATPMAYGGVYTALQQGVLDGAENAPGNVVADKFYEITKYYSLTRHFRPPGVFGMSLKVWNRLTPEDQKVLQTQAIALQSYEIDLTKKVEQQAIDELRAKGMQVNDADTATFRKAVEPVYQKFKAKFGAKLVDAIEAVK
jgi:TRAP-type transport system periplasmic protein